MNKLIGALACLVMILSPARSSGVGDVPASWRHDAELESLFFLDAERGWAVGDRGVVWQTTDGGRVWNHVSPGVQSCMHAVHFTDEQHGWIAGGDAMPYSHISRGTLLTTSDGGKTWTNDLRAYLPRITRLSIRGGDGWAVGEPSALFPGGLFLTGDGGRTWSTQPQGADFPAWSAAAATSRGTIALAAPGGVYATATGGKIVVAAGPVAPTARPRAMTFIDDTDGFLVGDEGLLLTTRDGGRIWRDASAALPAAARACDFFAIESHGRNLWLVGSPGSVVWHSPDAGQTWTAYPTGQPAPLRAITFIDANRGWAAGALGRIIATRDGGRTWRTQIGSARRAAVLGVHADAGDLPAAFYAKIAANDGHRAVAIAMHQPLSSSGPRATTEHLFRDVVSSLGGVSAEAPFGFPLPDDAPLWNASALAEAWGQARNGDSQGALAAYEAYLVRQIRTWRPEIVITHDPAAARPNSLQALTAELTLRAVQLAANPAAHAESARTLGLAPWRVERVYGAMNSGEAGTIQLVPDQVAPQLGRSLAEVSQTARGQLGDDYEPAVIQSFRPLMGDASASGGKRDFFSNRAPTPEKDNGQRDASTTAPPADLASVQRRVIARRNAQAIFDRARRTQGNTLAWLGQLDALSAGLDGESAAEIAYQLALDYELQGQWRIAAEAHRVVSQRFGKTTLAPLSLVWLMKYETSGEIAHRIGKTQDFAVRPATAELPIESKSSRIEVARRESSASRVPALLSALAARDPRLAEEPLVKHLAARTARLAPTTTEGRSPFEILAKNSADAPWRAVAEREAALAAGRDAKLSAAVAIPRIPEKPYLDGKHDERIWHGAVAVPLGGDSKTGGDVRMAHDGEFLYVAVRCPTTGSEMEALSTASADHDRDLSPADRIELAVDIDRDYATFFNLAIDAAGRTSDSCGRDATWNPEWFAARRVEAGAWTAELAIPLAELGDRLPRKNDPWAISLRRIHPGVGIHATTSSTTLAPNPASFQWVSLE